MLPFTNGPFQTPGEELSVIHMENNYNLNVLSATVYQHYVVYCN